MRMVVGVASALMLFGCAESQPAQRSTAPEPSSPPPEATASGEAVNPDRQDAIERVFQRKVGDLQACWSAEYEKTHDRKLEGDVTVNFQIAPNGTPGDIKVVKSSLNNPTIEGCVQKAIADWSFPEGQATVPYMRTVHLGAEF